MNRREFLTLTSLVALGAGVDASAAAYPSTPEAVVRAYLDADFGGAGTDSDTFPNLKQYAVWPDAPGWDTFTIVSGYRTAPLGRPTSRRAKVRATYAVLGVLEGEEAKETPKEQIIDYVLVRRGGGWKIASPQLEPHVSTDVAMKIVDNMANSTLFTADPEKIRLSREAIQKMAAARRM